MGRECRTRDEGADRGGRTWREVATEMGRECRTGDESADCVEPGEK